MVNTGRPSSACLRCRQRRIKCDAKRPGCDRCAKRGLSCPGYPAGTLPEVGDETFRDDTARTQERAQRKWVEAAKRQKIHVQKPDDTYPTPESSNGYEFRSRPRVASITFGDDSQRAPQESGALIHRATPMLMQGAVTQGAISILVSQTRDDREVFWPSFDCIGDVCARAPANSSVLSALEALSLVNLVEARNGSTRQPPATALNVYGRALKRISFEIADPKLRLGDDTFLAVQLICLFEALVDRTARDRINTHLHGMSKVLGSRGEDQFSRNGRRLFLSTFMLLNTGAIAESQTITVPTTTEVDELLKGIRTLTSEELFESAGPQAIHGVELRYLCSRIYGGSLSLQSEASLEKLLMRIDNAARSYNVYAEREMLRRLKTANDRTFLETYGLAHRMALEEYRWRCLQALSRYRNVMLDIAACVQTSKEFRTRILSIGENKMEADDVHGGQPTAVSKSGTVISSAFQFSVSMLEQSFLVKK